MYLICMHLKSMYFICMYLWYVCISLPPSPPLRHRARIQYLCIIEIHNTTIYIHTCFI
ncbi:hypothetical protein T492DRAFT_1066515 [Pavlovales sp. CCMP2436]|nr:hypothetical protein T492DRAFT_1066515 [Pavlovales sp. CCMP2436]